MKVLLNLISTTADIDKRPVIDWVLRHFGASHDDACVLITPETLDTGAADLQQIVLQPPRNKMALAAWKKIKLYPVLRKQQADVIITWEVLQRGVAARQILIASPADPASFTKKEKKPPRLDKGLARAKENCDCIIVFSEAERQRIKEHHPSLAATVRIVYRIPFPLNDLPESVDTEATKEKWSSGNEFFMAPPGIAADRLTLLLKGFSGFKKWQKSNMQLLLSFATDTEAAAIQALLRNYRFRESVQLVAANNDDYWKVAATAYAAILPERFDSDFEFLFKAMALHTPVLISEKSMYAEVTATAAFLFDGGNKEAITRSMLYVFKEERERSLHIQSGDEVAGKWRPYDPAAVFFECITTCPSPACSQRHV